MWYDGYDARKEHEMLMGLGGSAEQEAALRRKEARDRAYDEKMERYMNGISDRPVRKSKNGNTICQRCGSELSDDTSYWFDPSHASHTRNEVKCPHCDKWTHFDDWWE